MITLVLADDHPLVRQGLRAVVEATEDIVVVAEAADGHEAVRHCVEQRPDVVLMDLQMPGMRGLEATSELARCAPDTKVLVLTMFDDDDTVLAALQSGAIGYLLKGAEGAAIVAAVRAAATGQTVLGAAPALRVREWLVRVPTRPELAFPELTPRERDILDGVAAGLSNAEIGQRLHLSPKTVANNVSTILDKLHLASRPEAVVKARDAGMGG